MALESRHSISTFVILFLVFQEYSLVICDVLKDNSLKKALEAVERRERDLELQENEYYGQPENIGYGFQKTLGFFDNTGPAPDLGSFDSGRSSDANLLLGYSDDDADYNAPFEKRRGNTRERIPSGPPAESRLINPRDSNEEYFQRGLEYLDLLRNLWAKYRESRADELTVEDLTDEQVEEMLNSLYQKGSGEGRYDHEDPYASLEVVPLRSRKNYRVFEGFGDRKGASAKRNSIGYYSPSENDFLYSLKYVNPGLNQEAVENLRAGFEVVGNDKDRDIMGVLESGRGRHGEEDGPFWVKDEEDGWLAAPLMFPEKEERGEVSPRVFKNHEGIHLGSKRLPVKRSSVRVRKEVRNEKEVKGIFSPSGEPVTSSPKKISKKPSDLGKKNVTKHEEKKVIRRSEKYSKEVFPGNRNEEIVDIFSDEKKSKKSIDWSKHFGLDKRTGASWLTKDYLRRAESHLWPPKRKRYFFDQYEIPFDTRRFNEKRSSIGRMEDKISDMEEKIIDDALKYTGAHSGGSLENLAQVKSNVIQRLEAAYSLEKMKTALEEFKNFIKPDKKSDKTRKTSTEPPRAEARTTVPKDSPSLEKPLSEKATLEVRKRIVTKKEGEKGSSSEEPSDSVEFLNKFGRKQYEKEGCPVLERILENCLRVEEMWGRYAEVMVPLCSLQQMCYFCGAELGFSKMSTCDAMYLSEARNVCQDDSDCLVSARNAMLALQDLYEQDLFARNAARLPSDSCLANPCIQRYFLGAPGAILPPQMHK